MKHFIQNILAAALATIAVSCTGGKTYEFASLYEGLQFDMPRVERPRIPSRSVCITDFGGVGDGLTLNTKAFADAIDKLVSLGGGRITVPAGMWLSGPITMKSGIELHLEKNAVLMFDPDMDLYPIIETNFEGQDMKRCISPINAYQVKDIAITGEGIIDGNGQAWRELKRFNCPPKLFDSRVAGGGVLSDKGDVWFPDEGYKLARENSNGFNKPNDGLDLQFIKRFLRPGVPARDRRFRMPGQRRTHQRTGYRTGRLRRGFSRAAGRKFFPEKGFRHYSSSSSPSRTMISGFFSLRSG